MSKCPPSCPQLSITSGEIWAWILLRGACAVCLYFQSMSEHSKHHTSPWPRSFQTNLSTKLREHWGQDVTVCRVCGPFVVWLPVYSVCDHWRNCVLQLPEQHHSDSRYAHNPHTRWFVVCGWNDSSSSYYYYYSQSCRPPEATNFGSDWRWLCCRPSWLVEASSWRRKLCCDWLLLVTPEQVTPRTLGGGSIFTWCKFCVCNIMYLCVCRWWGSWIPEGLAVVGRLVNQ